MSKTDIERRVLRNWRQAVRWWWLMRRKKWPLHKRAGVIRDRVRGELLELAIEAAETFAAGHPDHNSGGVSLQDRERNYFAKCLANFRKRVLYRIFKQEAKSKSKSDGWWRNLAASRDESWAYEAMASFGLTKTELGQAMKMIFEDGKATKVFGQAKRKQWERHLKPKIRALLLEHHPDKVEKFLGQMPSCDA